MSFVGIVGFVVSFGVVVVVEEDGSTRYAVVCPVGDAAFVIGVWAYDVFAGCLVGRLDGMVSVFGVGG